MKCIYHLVASKLSESAFTPTPFSGALIDMNFIYVLLLQTIASYKNPSKIAF